MNPLVIIAGPARWLPQITTQLEQSFTVQHWPLQSGHIRRLIEAQPVLIVVDATAPQWARWVSGIKANNATRRMPVLVVTDSLQRHQETQQAGADATVTQAELQQQPQAIFARYAMLPHESVTQLAQGCAQPLPPTAREAIALFNAGEYYRQHDLLEALWMETQTPVRELYRAILQVGIAYYQIRRSNYRGALKILQRSVQWINRLPPVCQGVDVAQLQADSSRVRVALEAHLATEQASFDLTLLQPVRFAITPPEQ